MTLAFKFLRDLDTRELHVACSCDSDESGGLPDLAAAAGWVRDHVATLHPSMVGALKNARVDDCEPRRGRVIVLRLGGGSFERLARAMWGGA